MYMHSTLFGAPRSEIRDPHRPGRSTSTNLAMGTDYAASSRCDYLHIIITVLCLFPNIALVD